MLTHAEFNQFQSSAETFFYRQLGLKDGQTVFYAGQRIFNLEKRAQFYTACIKDIKAKLEGQQPTELRHLVEYKRTPIGIREFVLSKDYLNRAEDAWPKVLQELEEMNNGEYQEVILTGGIGCAKTTTAIYSIAYQLYLLSCLAEPHKAYGLDGISEIIFVFQSISAKISKASFTRFKSLIEQSPYFKNHFPFDKTITSKLVFPNRIEVTPISGQETGAIGQNVIGGMIDEMNYMEQVEKSKKSVDAGQFDQAVALYNSIARRRKTRFAKAGKMPGLLCLVSSKRYPGQFTDGKEAERAEDIRLYGKSTIYLYDYRVWEVKPPGSFSEERFYVFAGDDTRRPRILKAGEVVKEEDRHLVVGVPIDFLNEFKKDVINALREIAGFSTLARHPYFVDVESVAQAFNKHPSIFGQEWVDFVTQRPTVFPASFHKPHLPRFVHIDLAVSGDSCGLAIGCVETFRSMQSLGMSNNSNEMMPMIRFDGILEIKPPKGGEILFYKVREILTTLRDMGLNIRWVSFDTYQSQDSIQILRQQGFVVGTFSLDKDNKGYDCFKSAIYTKRVSAPHHPKAQKECITLEKNEKDGKIDHPPLGSKDCSDAMAGVAFGLTNRREVWGMFGIPIVMVPSSVSSNFTEDKETGYNDPEDVQPEVRITEVY